MGRKSRRKVAAGALAVLAVAGGGAAIAATQLSPQQESQAVLDDAAGQLGVTPDQLSAALKSALEKRVDAAVAAGRITKAQGDELKRRIESGDLPLFGFGGPRGPGELEHHGLFRGLDAAASYLGVSEEELHSQLESGKTLAEVAKAGGKGVGGLVDALVADAKAHVDEGVKEGDLTQAQADAMLARLRRGITAMVNGQRPDGPPAWGSHEGFRGFDGPPDFGGDAA
jgi:hypothetical protein